MPRPFSSPKILVAPLDWGLGHATRCIPIIKELIQGNCTVLIAASGKIKTLLKAEFPSLEFLDLPGYDIKYAASGWGLAPKIVVQIPKLISAINKEKQWLKELVNERQIDAVISDNRYGLHHPAITSIFITHQLRIKAPFKIIEDILGRVNYSHINQFGECWIPDEPGEDNLAGILSHPPGLPKITVRYLGLLSRFSKKTSVLAGGYVLILLSGPEPQRTLLEKKMLLQLKEYSGPVVMIRGLPQETGFIQSTEQFRVFNHLPAHDLEKMICDASMVISRCGYSTVMDLAALKKKSVLIPTPGQTEQIYLSQHLMKKKFALCIPQQKFRLKQALELARSFPYQFQGNVSNNFQQAIQSLVNKINKRNNSLE